MRRNILKKIIPGSGSIEPIEPNIGLPGSGEPESELSQYVKSHSDLNIFKSIKSGQSIDKLEKDTLYLDCIFVNGVVSDYNTSYSTHQSLKGLLSSQPPENVCGVHIFTKNNYYIATYVPEYNSLLLRRIVFDICIEAIMGVVKTLQLHEQTLIKNKITNTKTISMSVNTKLYNVSINDIQNKRLWYLKQALSSHEEDDLILMRGKNIFNLKLLNDDIHTKLVDLKVTEISRRAMAAINEVKRNYDEKLRNIKELAMKELSDSLPIPDISMSDIIKNRLMIARYKSNGNSGIVYSFIVDVVVDSAYKEETGKFLKLKKAYNFPSNILSLYISKSGILEAIKLFDSQGKFSKHMHVNDDNGKVCTGTYNVIGQRFLATKDIFELKNRILNMLSTVNLSNYYRGGFSGLKEELDLLGKDDCVIRSAAYIASDEHGHNHSSHSHDSHDSHSSYDSGDGGGDNGSDGGGDGGGGD